MRAVFTASCFVHYKGKVLLIHHKRSDFWLPVGGELNSDEPPMVGAYRETYEETGIEVEFSHDGTRPPIGTPEGFIGYEEHGSGEKGQHMNFCFMAMAVAWKEPAEMGPDTWPFPVTDGSWEGHLWVDPSDPHSYTHLVMPPNVRDLLKIVAERLKTGKHER